MKMTTFLFERMAVLFATAAGSGAWQPGEDWYWEPYGEAFTPAMDFVPDQAKYIDSVNWGGPPGFTGTIHLVTAEPDWSYEIGTGRFIIDWRVADADHDFRFITDAADVLPSTIHGMILFSGTNFAGPIVGSMLLEEGPVTVDGEEENVDLPRCRFYLDPAFHS